MLISPNTILCRVVFVTSPVDNVVRNYFLKLTFKNKPVLWPGQQIPCFSYLRNFVSFVRWLFASVNDKSMIYLQHSINCPSKLFWIIYSTLSSLYFVIHAVVFSNNTRYILINNYFVNNIHTGYRSNETDRCGRRGYIRCFYIRKSIHFSKNVMGFSKLTGLRLLTDRFATL